jgi:uncharacterized repeat protein (TIGR04138 family)
VSSGSTSAPISSCSARWSTASSGFPNDDTSPDLALDRFGVLARLVLESWGIHNSLDIGDVVFTLVELELLMSQPTDSRDEFSDVFDFDQAFERDYPWCAQFV